MVTFDMLLDALYQIQGASDPNDNPESQSDRLAEIYAIACKMMEKSGYQPQDYASEVMARQAVARGE